jgi:hypothetical protein
MAGPTLPVSSVKDLNVAVRELIDKEVESVMNSVREEIKELIVTIDKKIVELNQYLKA